MKKIITLAAISVFFAFMISIAAEAAPIGFIDAQKVFSSYEKTKKSQDELKKKEKNLQEEIEKRKRLLQKEKEKGASDDELKKIIEQLDKELEPRRAEIREAQKKMTLEIHNDIIKASEEAAKKAGVEIVLDKQIFITGGVDLTDQVMAILSKKR